MSFETSTVTHGAISFYKQTIERAITLGGWSRQEDIEDRGLLGAATVVQTNTEPVDFNVAGLSTGVWYELPLMYLGAFTAWKNFTTPVVEGVDFDISRVRGRVLLRAGGQFDNGAGVGVGRFCLSAGYEIKRGWTVLSSPGINGTEALFVGLRFEILNSNPKNPIRGGARWTCFSSWVNSSTDYDSANLAVRNAPADDVCQFLHTNYEVTYHLSVNLNRIIVHGNSAGFSSWVWIGALTRYRPQAEQPSVIAMMGNAGKEQEGNTGPVGQPNNPGTMGANQGTVWLYDLGVFSSVANPVELNANYWSFESGNLTLGYTPSRRMLNSPAPGGTPYLYFEVHDVITARNLHLTNDVSNVLYGLWDGIRCVFCYNARHLLELTYEGAVYRLLSVGSSWSRFIALAKV